jgi:hypothetical protein
MSYLFILTTLVLSTSEKILEQGDAFVPISDLDAYVYLLEPVKRPGFINDKRQIEKNLITMLNINIVNDYIESNDLKTHIAFSNIDETVNDMAVNLDDEFYLKLGIDKDTAHNNVKKFIVKKERFVRMSDLIKNQLLDGAIDGYLNEYFIINKSRFIKPEKRDISIIQLDIKKYDSEKTKNILNDLLKNDDFEYFSQIAADKSSDSSVQLNQGHLKEFRKNSFSYPFADTVFNQKSTGVIPRIFKYNDHYYIVRINQIREEVQPKYEDYKEQLTKELLPELVEKKLQRIIDSQAKFKIKLNDEVAAHIFERYKVLL